MGHNNKVRWEMSPFNFLQMADVLHYIFVCKLLNISRFDVAVLVKCEMM